VKTKKISVLASVYACGPNWGSEVGMGWNWTQALGKLVDLTVITELGFKDEINKYYKYNGNSNNIKFVYIDAGELARKYFWGQGDWRIYPKYKKWQKKSLVVAKELIKNNTFDLVHQLNMIGYREPGYLYELDLPYVWGPIGGHAQVPLRYLSVMGIKGAIQNLVRNMINHMQMRFHPRVLRAMEKASVLIAATPEDMKCINNIHQRDSHLILESGPLSFKNEIMFKKLSKPLNVLWNGIFMPLKAFPLALHAIKLASEHIDIKLTVIGDGECKILWKKEADNLGISNLITWTGRITHKEALLITNKADVLLFTSLKEGTPHVVFEAMSFGLPVVCHSICGFGEVVNESCGIKIPVVNPTTSIKGFSSALIRLSNEEGLLEKLSKGALNRIGAFTYEKKAKMVLRLYKRTIEKGKK
jgi:glycosyltransferase involved in cell wall biosynthesis